ncbi:unnamed protein product [Adineta ricciae]|uniref:AIG1-type G domain-containing protein n=1 Tax=Adineta ricciae TaxID=249248 RepID=A0A816ELV3_ADIRI|nr:unnamed protein product [Adineta ricciae]CAF1651020.1 unnamed protein product [Adineta ricciae]
MCAQRTKLNTSTSKYGLILLGNTGVGKSFIGNVVLGRDVFEHECSSSSVTHETEFEDYTIGNGSFAVFNIPGLIEAEQAAVDRNKIEIYKAFQQRPNSVVAFVFSGGSGGRIRDEDIVAFKAINDVYHFDSESLLFIINDLPNDRSSKYEGETAIKLERLTEMPNVRMCFLDRISKKTVKINEPGNPKAHGTDAVGKKFKDIKNFFKKQDGRTPEKLPELAPELDEREMMRRKLMDAIMSCTPRVHEKRGDIQLNVDKMKSLIEESKRIQQQFEEQRDKLQKEIEQRQRDFDEYKRQQEAKPHEVHHYHEKIIERGGDGGGLGGLLGIISPIANFISRIF